VIQIPLVTGSISLTLLPNANHNGRGAMLVAAWSKAKGMSEVTPFSSTGPACAPCGVGAASLQA